MYTVIYTDRFIHTGFPDSLAVPVLWLIASVTEVSIQSQLWLRVTVTWYCSLRSMP